MAPSKTLINRTRTITASALFISAIAALIAFTVFIAGCGDNAAETTPTSTTPVVQPVKINHIGPLSIEVLDNKSDIISSNEHELASAPQFMDINWVDISKEGESLKFTMELNSSLPEKAEAGKVGEWGFLLDTDDSGTPDWGIYASVDAKNGWTYALNNMKTNEKQALAAFPGTFAQGGTTIIWTMNPNTPAMGQSFKWMSFGNYIAKSESGQAVNAMDTIPDLASLSDSSTWPLFP